MRFFGRGSIPCQIPCTAVTERANKAIRLAVNETRKRFKKLSVLKICRFRPWALILTRSGQYPIGVKIEIAVLSAVRAVYNVAVFHARPSRMLVQVPLTGYREPVNCPNSSDASSYSEKRLQPGLRPAKDQGVHVVRAFIGVDGFQVLRVAEHMVADLDA